MRSTIAAAAVPSPAFAARQSWCASCNLSAAGGMHLAQQNCVYAIVGGGLAGASAAQGIRELNRDDSIVLLGREDDLPYDRPPLSKKLWFGEKKVEDIFIHDEKYYRDQNVDVKRGADVVALDPSRKEIRDSRGAVYHFEKLLLATGGLPRTLNIPGGSIEGVCYYRHLGDYRKIRANALPGSSAVIVGGGFIGSEMAAALNVNQVDVTMIFPEDYLVRRVFPENLGRAIQHKYLERGVRVLSGDVPVSFERTGRGAETKLVTRTRKGQRIESDIIIVGIGIYPSIELAQGAGLRIGNGIVVDTYLQTSHPDIYAAGDNAYFPYLALNRQMRVEHRDNALNQGRQAGRNMAWARESYGYMPYFFSDLFEFGYEAVGEVDSSLETVMDWQKEYDTGVIYYAKNGNLRGAMMCNLWNKTDRARELIRNAARIAPEQLPKVA
jgi:3-phenylpropionate/trans-cinnamate dioxygenase ferredoxin reductase component